MKLKLNTPLETTDIKLIQAEKKNFSDLYDVAKDPQLWVQHNAKDRWQKEIIIITAPKAIRGRPP